MGENYFEIKKSCPKSVKPLGQPNLSLFDYQHIIKINIVHIDL